MLCSSWGAEGGGDALHDAFWLANSAMSVWVLSPAQCPEHPVSHVSAPAGCADLGCWEWGHYSRTSSCVPMWQPLPPSWPTWELPQRQEDTRSWPLGCHAHLWPCLSMLTRAVLPAGAGGADLIGGVWPAGPVQGTALLRLGVVVPKCPCAEEHPRMVPVWLVAGGGSEDGTVVHHLGPMQA